MDCHRSCYAEVLQYYESDIDRHHEMEGVWYMDMPVSNVMRSTGKPGKIHISVSASGLASGSFDIDSEDSKTDNSLYYLNPFLRMMAET